MFSFCSSLLSKKKSHRCVTFHFFLCPFLSLFTKPSKVRVTKKTTNLLPPIFYAVWMFRWMFSSPLLRSLSAVRF